MKHFSTNMAIQNFPKSNDKTKKEEEAINADLLKKIKLIEKAFK